jgi:hypothetical protein
MTSTLATNGGYEERLIRKSQMEYLNPKVEIFAQYFSGFLV